MRPGDLIDGFDLAELAGSGGMARVYRARERHSGQAVAVKLLSSDEATDNTKRFAREVRVLADLRHPGIVRYFAHGLTRDGQPYLAMEWLEGEDLKERLARQSLSVEECVELARRVAEALGEAHAQGVIHRDIKPRRLGSLEPAKQAPRGRALKLITSVHRRLYRWTNGLLGSDAGGLATLLLTTTGRKTGMPRTVPLPYFPHPEGVAVAASFAGAPKHPRNPILRAPRILRDREDVKRGASPTTLPWATPR